MFIELNETIINTDKILYIYKGSTQTFIEFGNESLGFTMSPEEILQEINNARKS